MLMTANPKVTGTLRLPLRQKVLGWSSTAVMFLVAVGMDRDLGPLVEILSAIRLNI